jgi:hypothetical protein
MIDDKEALEEVTHTPTYAVEDLMRLKEMVDSNSDLSGVSAVSNDSLVRCVSQYQLNSIRWKDVTTSLSLYLPIYLPI